VMALVLTGALGALGVAVAAAMWWRRRAVGVQAELQAMRRRAEQAEQAAVAAQGRLHDVIEGAPAAVFVLEPSGAVALANAAASAILTGRHGDALVLEAVRGLCGELQRGGVEQATRALDLAGPPRRSVALTARRLPEGEVLVITDDITERRRIDDVRRDFVANISHELKTPIGAMALLAETMTDEDDPQLLARLSQRLHREAMRVSSTIDDLLLLSRIETDEQPRREPVRLDEVVAHVVERSQPAAALRDIEVRTELVEPPVELLGDRRQLESAVYNLLDNAVKYSDEGSEVVVRTTRNERTVGIEVADRGIGIPAKDLERVFERFYRVDRARSRSTGGTGLGLSIVRHVAYNHGGTVRVASREGEGSTFRLELPDGLPAPAGSPVTDEGITAS
jgi:two-component system sensor histidine kinase SenX3